jgi:ribonuclease-3
MANIIESDLIVSALRFTKMIENLHQLEQIIGYQFQDKSLLMLALTHRSAKSEHNERLEFIGDGIVNFIVGEALFHNNPSAPEGELSRWRASLVQRETLAELARVWHLEQYVLVGPGEKNMGGHERPSTLANAFEAILGALYFDAGFEQTKKIILNVFSPRLSTHSIQNIQKDAKTMLQEYLQAKQHPLPIYEITNKKGQEHETLFEVSCTLTKLQKHSKGYGTSKRKAEQDAAQNMLNLLK